MSGTFFKRAVRGDIIEIGMETVKAKQVLSFVVMLETNVQTITSVDEIVFVNIGSDGKTMCHGVTNEVYES